MLLLPKSSFSFASSRRSSSHSLSLLRLVCHPSHMPSWHPYHARLLSKLVYRNPRKARPLTQYCWFCPLYSPSKKDVSCLRHSWNHYDSGESRRTPAARFGRYSYRYRKDATRRSHFYHSCEEKHKKKLKIGKKDQCLWTITVTPWNKLLLTTRSWPVT